jgi:tryptophan synthase alpha chain
MFVFFKRTIMAQTHTLKRIATLFEQKKQDILSVYCTAGFPNLNDTIPILEALQASGVDMIEIGMPFSDPIADGPTIQESGTHALQNGMTMEVLFEQLRNVRQTVTIPLVLMGYVNPVMQFGVENFCKKCANTGIDGVILPDLPVEVFEQEWQPLFEKYQLCNILLITPQTSKERVQRIDAVSSGFLYAVSSAGTTGGALAMDDSRTTYFQRLQDYKAQGIIRNPIVIGFGIHDKASFDAACQYADGAIIGSAFIKALSLGKGGLNETVHNYISTVR